MTNATVPRDIKLARILLLVAAVFYATAIHFGHVYYLEPVWGYFGFSYAGPGLEYLFALSLIVVVSCVLPLGFDRPSALIVLLLFVVVYVPTITLGAALREDAFTRYGLIMASLCVAMTAVSIAARVSVDRNSDGGNPDKWTIGFLVALWCALGAVLVARYGRTMSFAGLDRIYQQREAGAATDALSAYAQTYFGVVLSPALIALGLAARKYVFAALGAVGCLLMYAITAQKFVFLLPVAIVAFWLMLRSRWWFFSSSAFVVGLVAVGAALSTLIALHSPLSPLPVYLQFRTLGLPGLTLFQYYDVFSDQGFTYWSHVKGVSSLVPPPSISDSRWWPSLGRMVGEAIYANPQNNQNANLFAADGVAAAGALGVLVIGAALSAWLIVFDRVSRRWNSQFTALIALSMGLVLTNGQLSTMLLSFGGIFWTIFFAIGRAQPMEKQAERDTDNSAEKQTEAQVTG